MSWSWSMKSEQDTQELCAGHRQGTGQKKGKNYSTSYSRVISHRSTDDAITSLTSEIGRDPVLSSVYGRSWRCGRALGIVQQQGQAVVLLMKTDY